MTSSSKDTLFFLIFLSFPEDSPGPQRFSGAFKRPLCEWMFRFSPEVVSQWWTSGLLLGSGRGLSCDPLLWCLKWKSVFSSIVLQSGKSPAATRSPREMMTLLEWSILRTLGWDVKFIPFPLMNARMSCGFRTSLVQGASCGHCKTVQLFSKKQQCWWRVVRSDLRSVFLLRFRAILSVWSGTKRSEVSCSFCSANVTWPEEYNKCNSSSLKGRKLYLIQIRMMRKEGKIKDIYH